MFDIQSKNFAMLKTKSFKNTPCSPNLEVSLSRNLQIRAIAIQAA